MPVYQPPGERVFALGSASRRRARSSSHESCEGPENQRSSSITVSMNSRRMGGERRMVASWAM